jgi:GMP synthase (glutamine-hydrolysing)
VRVSETPSTQPESTHLADRPVLVVDFGAQYAQLIARRVREANCFSEVVPHSMPVAEMLAKDPAAVILSGGPSSVYEDGAPSLDPALLQAGVPVFGMCYGFQAMAQALGGTVERTGSPSSAPPPPPSSTARPRCSTASPSSSRCG